MGFDNGVWVAGVGDPTVIGWFTTIVYFLVSIICLRAFATSNSSLEREPIKVVKIFWLFLAFILIALGINKQLDLQSLLTQIGRDIIVSQGWYKNRRLIQMWFIALISLSGLAGLTVLAVAFRNACSAVKITFAGCIVLFVFIIVRAASFHHIEVFVNIKSSGINMNGLLELSGLAIIATGGAWYLYLQRSFINKI